MLMRTATVPAPQALPIDEVLAEVERFCADELEPAVTRHECVAGLEQLQGLHKTLAQIGLLADGAESSGLGLSLAVLRLVARHNMGMAWSLHLHALARLLERRLGVPPLPRLHAALQGRYGLARGALAAHLCGRALDAADAETLRDYFDAERAPGLFVHICASC